MHEKVIAAIPQDTSDHMLEVVFIDDQAQGPCRACNAPSVRSRAISDTSLLSDRARLSFRFRVCHLGMPHPLSVLPPKWALWPLAGGAPSERATRSLPCRSQVHFLLDRTRVHQVEIQLQFFDVALLVLNLLF